MARAWTLYQTLAITTGGSLLPNSRMLVNGAGDTAYFVVNDSPHSKIYSWDGGASLTDIAGTNFPNGSSSIKDICIFNGSLFCAYGNDPVLGTPTSIYKWNGGTSWTNEYTLVDESPPGDGWIGKGFTGDSWAWAMDCDDNYMAIAGTVGNYNTETFRRMWKRDTAGNYTIDTMPGGSYSAPGYHLVGKSKGSDYGSVVGYNRLTTTNFQPIIPAWTNVTASGIGAKIPIGYGDGKSFFSQNTPTGTTTWELKYSVDWNNLIAAGGLTRDGSQKAEWKFKNTGNGVIMVSLDSEQAYTWDSDLAIFVADGTTEDINGTRNIYDFFRLNGQLFALTTSIASNSVEIWLGSEPACQASLYYGIETPVFASNLPFCVQPGGLAISPETYIAVLGTGQGDVGQSVVYQLPPYNGAWTDISGGVVPTGTAVTSIKFV